jgi:SPP1 family phage portal protein
MAAQGIKKIKIPIKPNELTIELVEKYLNDIDSQFETNRVKIREFYDKYCLNHRILTKVRAHEDTDINNIVLIPTLKAIIDWKTGYVFGNPIKYAQSKSSDTDDIEYLNKYVRSVSQRSVDKEVGTWVYATGVGYYFIEPKSEKVDISTEAPYDIYCRDSDSCVKIYSAFGGNKALFDILYTTYEEISDNGAKKEVKLLDIYFTDTLYTYKSNGFGKFERIDKQSRGMKKPLPLVEKRANVDGIGIVAMGDSMQYALDKLISNGLDNVEDIVNEIFVYQNVNLGETSEEQKKNHIAMKKNGAVVLNSNSKELPAKLDTISSKMSLSEIREMFSVVNAAFHSAIGVPMEISNTNSGGTTKQGSEVANGYDNAYNRALDDINTFIKADTELLEKIMWICKNTPNNKMDNLSTSEIEIKYSLNLTDNMLTKSQAYGTYINTMPPAMALRMCRLSNDAEAEGKLIEEYMAKKQSTNNGTNGENL